MTYLFEGEILHRDSLGSEQAIRPEALNWMTAGQGIAHSERTATGLRAHSNRLLGIQSWAALPAALEETAPGFTHHPAEALPVIEDQGARLLPIAGEGWGLRARVQTHWPLFYADLELSPGAANPLPDAHEERGAYRNGESFLYRGRCYRLTLVSHQDVPLLLKHGRFCLRRDLVEKDGSLDAAKAAFQAYYLELGAMRLSDRVSYVAPKAGVSPAGVAVRELGNRWASCSAAGEIAFHWKCMVVPQTIIDYIAVNEHCHMQSPRPHRRPLERTG